MDAKAAAFKVTVDKSVVFVVGIVRLAMAFLTPSLNVQVCSLTEVQFVGKVEKVGGKVLAPISVLITSTA